MSFSSILVKSLKRLSFEGPRRRENLQGSKFLSQILVQSIENFLRKIETFDEFNDFAQFLS